jgi:hypothetical protein
MIGQKRSSIEQTKSRFLQYDLYSPLLESAIPSADKNEENDEQASINSIGQSQKKWELRYIV